MADEVIDPDYWLAQGFKLVDGAYDRVLTHLADLNTYLTGLLSAYTLVAFISIIYAEVTDPWHYIALFAPFVLASIGKWYTVVAQLPGELNEFHPESWEQCKWIKEHNLRSAMNRLRIAKVITHGTALAMVAGWLFYYAADIKVKQEAKKATAELPVLQARLAKLIQADSTLLSVSRVGATNRLMLEGTFSIHDSVVVLTETDGRRTFGPKTFTGDCKGWIRQEVETVFLNDTSMCYVTYSYGTKIGDRRTVVLKVK